MYRYQPANIYQQLGAQEPQQSRQQPSLIQQRIQALQASVVQPPPPLPPPQDAAGVMVRYQPQQAQQQQPIQPKQLYHQQYNQPQQAIPPPMNHVASAPPMIQSAHTPTPGAQLKRSPTTAGQRRPLPMPTNVKTSDTAPVDPQMQMRGRRLSQGPTLPQQTPQGVGFQPMQHQLQQQPAHTQQPPSVPLQIPQQIASHQVPLQHQIPQQSLPPLPPQSRQDSPTRSRPLPSPTPAPSGSSPGGTRQSAYFSGQIPGQPLGYAPANQQQQPQGHAQAQRQSRIPPSNPTLPTPAQLMMMGKSMTDPIPVPPARPVPNKESLSTSPTKASILGHPNLSSSPTRQLPNTPTSNWSRPQPQPPSGLPPNTSSHIRLPSFPESSPNTTPTSTIKLKGPGPGAGNKGRASPPRFGVGPITTNLNASPSSSPGSSPTKGGHLANMFARKNPGRHGPSPQTAQPIPPSGKQGGKLPQKFTPGWKRTLPDILPPLLPTPPPQGPPSPKREAPPKHPHQQWQAYQEQLKGGTKAKASKEEKKAKNLTKEKGKTKERGKIRDFFGQAQPPNAQRPHSMHPQSVQPPLPRPPMQSQKSWEHIRSQQHQRQPSWENQHQRQPSWDYAPQRKQRPMSMFTPGQVPGPPPTVPKHTRPGSIGATSYTVSSSEDDYSEYVEAEDDEEEEEEEVDDDDSEYSYEYVYTYEDEHGRRVEVTMDRPPGEDGAPLSTPPPVLPPPTKPSRSQRSPQQHQYSSSIPHSHVQPFQVPPSNKPSKQQRRQHFRSTSSSSQLSSSGVSQYHQPSLQPSTQPLPGHQRSSSNLSHPIQSYERARSPSVTSSTSSSSSLSSPRAPSPLPESPRLSPMSPLGAFDAFVGPRPVTPTTSITEMMSPASSVVSLPRSPQYGIRDLPMRISGLPRQTVMGVAGMVPPTTTNNGGHDGNEETSRPTSATSNTSVSSGGFSSGSWVGVTSGDDHGGTIKRGFGPRHGHARGQSITMRIAAGEDLSSIGIAFSNDGSPTKTPSKGDKGKQKDFDRHVEEGNRWSSAKPGLPPRRLETSTQIHETTPTRTNVNPERQTFAIPDAKVSTPMQLPQVQSTPTRPQVKTPMKYDYEFDLDDTPPPSKPGWNAMRQQQEQRHPEQQPLQRQITQREPRQIGPAPVTQSPATTRRELPSTPPGSSPIMNGIGQRANRVQSQIFGSPNSRSCGTPEKSRPQSQIVSRYMAPLRDEPEEGQPKEALKRRPSGSRRPLPTSPGMGAGRPLSSSSNFSTGTSFTSPRSAFSNISPSSSRTSSPFNASSIISTCEIESPAPVGGRAKLADIGKLESASEGSVTPPPPFSPPSGRSRGNGVVNRQPPQQQRQRWPPSSSPLPAPVPISTINIGGVDEAERREKEKMERRGSVPVNVDHGSSPKGNNTMPPVPMINVQDDDLRPGKQDPQCQRPQPVPHQQMPQINVFDVPGISFSGPTNGPEITVSGSSDVSFSSVGGGPMIKVSSPAGDSSQRAKNQVQPHIRHQPQQGQKKGGLVCGGCGGSIIGRIVSAMNQRWHPNCFKCTVCEELLEHVSSYEAEGRPYCHLDYHENFAPRCYHCKTAIIEERFISLDDSALGKRAYHQQHFFCAECGDPFLTPTIDDPTAATGELSVTGDGDYAASDDVGFTVYRGHPYCEACHVRLRLPKCKRCKRSIRDHEEAVEALGGKWCWKCFICKRCEMPFDNPSFFQRGDDPYCEPCFSIILRNEV